MTLWQGTSEGIKLRHFTFTLRYLLSRTPSFSISYKQLSKKQTQRSSHQHFLKSLSDLRHRLRRLHNHVEMRPGVFRRRLRLLRAARGFAYAQQLVR